MSRLRRLRENANHISVAPRRRDHEGRMASYVTINSGAQVQQDSSDLDVAMRRGDVKGRATGRLLPGVRVGAV